VLLSPCTRCKARLSTITLPVTCTCLKVLPSPAPRSAFQEISSSETKRTLRCLRYALGRPLRVAPARTNLIPTELESGLLIPAVRTRAKPFQVQSVHLLFEVICPNKLLKPWLQFCSNWLLGTYVKTFIQLHSPLLILHGVSNLCLSEKIVLFLSSSERLMVLEINLDFQIPSWESFSTGKLFLTR